jgi:PAS domain S-box-containing protein
MAKSAQKQSDVGKKGRPRKTATSQRPPAGSEIGSDELVRLLLNSTGEGIYGVDLEGYCTFANPACAQLLGFENVEELLGQHMHDLVHHTRPNGEPYPVEECRIYRAFRERKGTHVDDEVMFRADGSDFPAEYWSYPVERNGELVGCVVTFRDISERRQNEALLAEQAAALREAARFPDMNPGPVLRLNLEGVVQLDNVAARRVFGDDLVGRCWQDICADLENAWDRILEAKEPVVLEKCVKNREFLFTHRRDFEGDVIFVYGTDVTEQKQAERALRQADEQIRLLLNSTGEGIYGIDLEGNCTFANPSCAKLLGFEDVDALLGQHMHNLVHHTRPNGEPYPVEECRIYQAFRKHEGTHVDNEVMFRADGSSFPTEYWSFPVERDGELVGCVVTFVDITERRQVEEELRQTEKMAALGKLSAGLAHELNNPAAAAGRAANQLSEALDDLQSASIGLARMSLTPEAWDTVTEWARDFRKRSTTPVVLSPLEASDREEELWNWLESHQIDDTGWMAPTLVAAGIGSKALDAMAAKVPPDSFKAVLAWLCRLITAHDLAGVVAQGTRSISELVNVVKSYSHMDRAPLQDVDIHDGLEDTIKILGHKLKRGIEVERQYDRDLPRIPVEGNELNQVWTNLIDNAIDAMGGKGTITIRTRREGDYAVVELADDGPGIPEDIQSRIFDPFFTTKDVGTGTGLGLDVVRRIVTNRCGGQIDVRSRPGETVFQVRLPLQIACDEEE